MEEILTHFGTYLLGVVSTWWYLKRPRKHVEEDRDAGILRYQKYKDRKRDD